MGRLEKSRRGYWANKGEFILTCIGYCWGATSWIRFPYLCYRNGGLPVFLIAYFAMMCHFGVPMMLLEMTLGQYGSQGVLTTWRMCPLFQGVGVSILLYGCIYLASFAQYFSIPIYYLYLSFTKPWLRCDNEWNTPQCFDVNNYDALYNSSSAMVSIFSCNIFIHTF